MNKLANFTSREIEIISCLSKGMTTNETAEYLYLSHETIKTYRSRLMQKFHAKNAFHLGVLVMQHGYLNQQLEVA